MAQPRMKKSVPMKIKKVVKAVVAPQGEAVVTAAQTGKHSADVLTIAIGRRKTATARVRLSHGGNVFTVNAKPAKEYFGSVDPFGVILMRPFVFTNTVGTFSLSAKVNGSGVRAQLDAVIHGVARALVKIDESNRKTLKEHGLLTRDDRMKESRKMGQGGKARKEKQSPKR